jgi:hypothetical protein
MRLATKQCVRLTHNGGAHGAPARERRGVSGPRKRLSLVWDGAPRENRSAVPCEMQNGGAHGAPAKERRGVSGPRKRLSRGVGRSPT